jgi:DNA primase catalytic core
MSVLAQHAQDRNTKSIAATMDKKRDAVEQIKARLPLENIIGETVALKPAGKNRLKGICPFHDEKTPSFQVSIDKGLYHCFGCKAQGSVFDFVMQTQGIDFRAALEILAQRAGVELESAESGARKRDLFDLNDLAQSFFTAQLITHPEARAYLEGRGLTAETVATWGLGYAPEGWTHLTQHLRSQGVELEMLELSGLARSKDGRYYDMFRHRVTIPIRDIYGRIVGFSGRTLGGDDAKYVNTPETAIFKKGELLFGLERAKGTLREKSAAILVEGQMDVIALHQAGFTAAVGAQSSTLTPAQIKTLEQLKVTQLSLAFDPDEAGHKATVNALNANQRRFNERVVKLDGKDPAEMIKDDPESFRVALDAAQTEAEYRYARALEGVDLNTKQGRDAFIEVLKPALGDLNKPGDGHELRSLAAAALGADVTTGQLKDFAGGKELTIDAHLEAADDAEERKKMVRDKVAGEIAPFPLEVFPAPLREYVEVCARALPVPPDFVAAPIMAVLATAIGHARKFVIKESWQEGPRLFLAVVGDPGSRKSPALGKANDPLKERQKHYKKLYDAAQDDYLAQLTTYETAKGSRKQSASPEHPGDAPELAQVMTTDATFAALIELHAKNPRSLLLFQDELSGWVMGMDQYKSGKGNDRQRYLSAWNGDDITVNRKGKPAQMVPNPHISVSGGIQPDILPTLQTSQGADGFVDRILFSYPKTVKAKSFSFDDDVTREHVAGYRKVVSNLWHLKQAETADGPQPKPLKMTEDAEDVFKAWIDHHNEELEAPGLDRKLRGAWAKMPGYFARFALILHLAAYAAGEEISETISAMSIGKAADLVEYFKSHAARVYKQLGDNPEDKSLSAIHDYIDRQSMRRCTPRALVHAKLPGCTNTKTTRAQLDKLADAGLGTLEEVKTASGQKSAMFVLAEKKQGVG